MRQRGDGLILRQESQIQISLRNDPRGDLWKLRLSVVQLLGSLGLANMYSSLVLDDAELNV